MSKVRWLAEGKASIELRFVCVLVRARLAAVTNSPQTSQLSCQKPAFAS
jgi:hypothetical protein